MKKIFNIKQICFTAVFVFLLISQRSIAQNQISFSEILDPNGKIKTNVSGSYNATGYTLEYGNNKEPIFTKANSSQQSTTTTWSALGSGVNATVYAIAVSGSDVYVGGDFTVAGGISAYYLAKWNGSTWSALGTGVDGEVTCIAINGSDVFVGGGFTTAGGITVNRIAKWNGSTWSALGLGVNSAVYAIAVSGSDVYVGGAFSFASSVSANFIAKWNGSTWSALGTGMNSIVEAIAVSGGNVFVGGFFTTAGGISANSVAKWNGSTWSALGTGMNGNVTSLAVSGSDVYIGGKFTTAGGISANNVAKLNGSTWSALGTGMDSVVYAIAVSGSDVFAGGGFTTAGGISANKVAKWNGTAWSAMGNGVNSSVRALADNINAGAMEVGGTFGSADGKFASYIAQFVETVDTPIDIVHLRLQNGFGKRGVTYSYPIYCDDSLKTADSVISGEFTVATNNVFTVTGIDTNGTMLGKAQYIFFNNATKKFVFANAQPITGKGVLIYLTVAVNASAFPGVTETVSLSGALLNEGTPSVAVSNGSFRPMDIFISPKFPPQNKVVGDSIFFSVSGDVTPPLFWSVGDTSVAVINASGKLTGKKVGSTYAKVTDSFGLQDQSNVFQINSPSLNSLTISVRDTSFMQNLTFDLPIYVSDVTSLGIVSAQWKLNYNSATLIAKSVITAGTIAHAWGTPTVNIGTGTVEVAMAGTDTLTGNGILAFVRFQVNRFAYQSSNLDLQNVLFNETITAAIDNAIFTPKSGPVISISPNVYMLTRGNALTYTASGGSPPYTWYSSDTLKAVVDSLTGKVTAKSRGSFILSAFDSQKFDGSLTISVNDFSATLPDTTVRIGDSVDVPIYLSDVTGLGILSAQIKIGYDTAKVRFSQLITAGTMSSGMISAVNDSGSVIRLALSGTLPLSGSGIFAKLRFHHKAPSGNGQFSSLTFIEYQNNEPGPLQPLVTLKNGKITVISSLNNNPLFTNAMADTTISEDQQLTFDYDAFDADGNTLFYAVQNQPSGMTIDSIAGILKWKPGFTQSGNYTITVSVVDGKGGSVSKQTNIAVLNTNRPPIFTAIMADTTVSELQQLTFDYNATDPDNDAIKYFLQNAPAGMAIDSTNGIMKWVPGTSQSGNYSFVIFAKDANGGNVSRQTAITVLNNNQSPVFTNVMGDTTVNKGEQLTFDYNASDPDNDAVTFFLQNAPPGMTIDTASGLMKWTPALIQIGNHSFTIFAKDNNGGLVSRQTAITVLNNNHPPVFTSVMGDTTLNEDQQLSFDYNASDPDNDPVKYYFLNAPSGMLIDSISGILSWKPNFSQSGSYSFVVAAIDINGGYVSKQTNITVRNVNRPPSFTLVIPETTYTEPGLNTKFTFTGQDPDNDTLTFTVVEAPNGAGITLSGQLSWTPTVAQVGTHRLIIKMTDASIGVFDTSYFVVTIKNSAPVFTATLNDTTISETQTLSFTYKAFDKENDSLFYSLGSLSSQPPAGLTLSVNGQLSWTPDYTQAGIYTVIVVLKDRQFSVLDTVKITVLNKNRVPQFVAKLPDLVTFVDSLVTFKYSAVDPDNDNLTFSLVKPLINAVMQSNGVFTWKPVASQLGKDTVIVAVNDGTVAVPDTAILTVNGFPFAEVSRTAFDFGPITFGGTKTISTIVNNKGIVPLIFHAPQQFNGAPDPNFILDTTGASIILPGQQDTISITYSPRTVGGHSTGYVFTTNDFRNPSYTFTAKGSAISTLVVTKRMMVDVQHNSTASLSDTVNGLGRLFTYLSKSGIQVTYSSAVLQPHGNDIVLLVTPQRNFTKPEIDSINNFVKNGGLLIALGNSAQEGTNDALNALLKDTSWTTNLSLNNDIVVDSSSNIVSPLVPLLTIFADAKHPFFTNVDTIVFFGSSSVNVSGSAIPFVTTTTKGKTIGGTGILQPAVAGLNKIGKGKILLMGDADAWRVDAKSDSVPPNIAVKDNLAFVLNILSITEDYEVKMPAKTSNERYQLVSIPFDLQNSDVKSVLKGLGDPNPLIWRLFGRYDPALAKYAEFPSEKFNSFRRGEAYWLITRGQFDITPGNATIVPVKNFYEIKIGPGYSIIGNPFPYKVSWKHSVHDSVQNVLWGYDGTGFKPESLAMEPFSGYFVKNYSADSLTIKINPQDITNLPNANLGKNSSVTASLNAGEWKVGISAASGKSGDGENFAGVAPGAKDEFDSYDIAEPPPTPTDYVIVRFPNKQWKQQPGSYATDIRAANEEGVYWDFEVISSNVQSSIDLTLTEFGYVPNNFSLYLIDKTTEKAVLLETSYQYQFSMMKNETRRNFRLIAGKTEFVEKNTQGIPLLALDYSLLQNYPNPFNPSTQIRYVLGHSGHVVLEIYNILGQRVRTLRNEFQTIGTYSVEWDGNDDSGITVSTGVYFYKVHVISNGEKIFTETKKMLLMK